MSKLCCAPIATFTFCPDRHVSPLLLSHPSKGCELICMTQRLSHTNKHRTNWLCCATYQLPRQSEQPQRFLFVYGRTARCVSSTRKYITVYYISIMRSLQWRTEANDNKQLWWWWYTQRKVIWLFIYTMKPFGDTFLMHTPTMLIFYDEYLQGFLILSCWMGHIVKVCVWGLLMAVFTVMDQFMVSTCWQVTEDANEEECHWQRCVFFTSILGSTYIMHI